MNFEYNYSKRVTPLLEQHCRRLDKLLQELLLAAGARHELGDPGTIKKIMTCCDSHAKTGINLLLKIAIDVVSADEKIIPSDVSWPSVSKKIQTQIGIIKEKKLKALKESQGSNLNRRLIDASSLDEEYKQYRAEAKHKFDQLLQSLSDERAAKHKLTLKRRLYLKLVCVGILVAVVIVIWLFKNKNLIA
jgi:hypothetical protein